MITQGILKVINCAVRIGASERQGERNFHAVNRAPGELFGPAVCEATVRDAADACALAAAAAGSFAALAPERAGATFSCADGVETRVGDVFEVRAEALQLPDANSPAFAVDAGLTTVRAL